MRKSAFLAAAILTAARLVGADAATPPDTVEAITPKLPAPVADAARRWLHGSPREVRALSAMSPADVEQQVMIGLASEPAAADFVLGRLADEPASTDVLVIKVIVVDAFWAEHPGVSGKLQALAASAGDPDLMLAYLDAARRIDVKRMRRLITSRIAAARAAGDNAALKTLARADERWILLMRGASMPGFMRRPPPVFAVMPAGRPVRLVGMGDFGTGSGGQRSVAAAIARMAQARPFDFGLTFGDNFYPSGMTGTDDPRWRDWWEALYGPLGITFYPSLGNHEWYSDDGAAAEIAYRSPTWRFPAPYYTFTAGPAQFFAVDTTEISEEEVAWLDKAIAASTSKWKVVYGHHPIFAPERDAKSGDYMRYMQARLWPLLKGRVDAYLCGHQHAMAHMEPRDGVHFFMSGGGGAPLGRVAAHDPQALFAKSRFGFLTLEADAASLRIAIYDTDGRPFDSETVTK
ncbi:MAG TPA: metallophosphoesterase [Opitutaceae bacterium]|jgi:hypothetical protein